MRVVTGSNLGSKSAPGDSQGYHLKASKIGKTTKEGSLIEETNLQGRERPKIVDRVRKSKD